MCVFESLNGEGVTINIFRGNPSSETPVTSQHTFPRVCADTIARGAHPFRIPRVLIQSPGGVHGVSL